jgi:hypothetical protein
VTALDVKQAKQALSWRLAQWGVTVDVETKAASFIDDLVSTGWQMAPDRESRRRPPRAGEDECRQHRGEYATACRACAAEQYTHPADPVLDDPTCTAGRQLLAEIRSRRQEQDA